MTPERLAEIERLAKSPNFRSVRYEAGIPLGPGRNLFDNETVADLLAHIRDLEAQVREAREKAEPQARPGWHAFDEACTCSLCRSRAAHLNGCTCVLCATTTPPSPEVGA